jgi:hypothetical protein
VLKGSPPPEGAYAKLFKSSKSRVTAPVAPLTLVTIPVNPIPEPKNEVAVIAPDTFTSSSSVCPLTSNPVNVPTDVMLGCAAVLTVPAKLPVNVVAVMIPVRLTLPVPVMSPTILVVIPVRLL